MGITEPLHFDDGRYERVERIKKLLHEKADRATLRVTHKDGYEDERELDNEGREFLVGGTVELRYDEMGLKEGTRGKILEIIPHPNGMSRAVIHYEGLAPPEEDDEPTPLFAVKVVV